MAVDFNIAGGFYNYGQSGQVMISVNDGWPILAEMTQITNAEFTLGEDDSSGTIDASAKGTTRLELISINGKPVKK
ncbi:MAG: hypothetical protein ACOX8I_10185 [Bacillota bacterium]|jgi:hypothetical protein